MADNVTLNPGAAGDTIAADDVGGVKYQVVKLAVGADGAAALVANANPIPISDAGGSVTVDGTVAVTGVATSAKQDTAQTSLDAIATSLAALDNAVAGNEFQVDVLTMPTVTVNSHAVTNAGTFPVQVDGAALTSLQLIDDAVFAEDVAAQAADKGVAILAVRRDADTSLVGADNDYANLQVNAAGSLKVAITAGAGSGGTSIADGATFTRDTTSVTLAAAAVESSAPTLTNGDAAALSMTTAGALRVSVTAGGVAGIVDDAAFTPGTTEGVMFMAELDNTGTDSVDEGDAGALRMSANRNLFVNLRDAAGNERGANINASNQLSVSVDNTVTVASHAVTNAGTFPVQAASAGVAADDAATSGNPVLIGGVAVETDGTDPTTVSAEGDAAYLRTDRARRLLVSEHHPRGFFVSADYGSAQTNASVKAAPGASLSLYITDIVISNGAVAGNITLLDGSGGTVVFEIYPAINGGCAISLKNPIRLTANTALCITSSTVTTHSVNIGGYIAP